MSFSLRHRAWPSERPRWLIIRENNHPDDKLERIPDYPLATRFALRTADSLLDLIALRAINYGIVSNRQKTAIWLFNFGYKTRPSGDW